MEIEEVIINNATHGKGTEEWPYYTSDDYWLVTNLRRHYGKACFLEDHSRADKPFVIVNGVNYYPKH